MYKKVRLTDLGQLSRGKSKHRPRNDESLYGGKYPFIQTADIKNAKWKVTKYSQTYNDKGLSQSKLWDKGTFCITIAANIADTAILDFPACFPDSVLGFVPDKNLANVNYIDYTLRKFKYKLEKTATQTAQKNINLGTFEELELNIPDINKQNEITSKIIPFDEKILLNDRIIEKLQEYIKLLFHKWFIDLDFPNDNRLPYNKNGGELVEHDNRKIPKGWRYATCDEFIRSTGIALRDKQEWSNEKLIDASNMSSFSISLDKYNLGNTMETNIFTTKKYDILFNSIRPYLGKMIVSPFDGVRTGTLHGINASEPDYYGFVVSMMMHDSFFQNAKSKSKGTKMPVIDYDSLLSYKVCIPPSKELFIEFNDIVTPLIESIIFKTNENFKLAEYRDLLIERLILS